MFDKARYFFIVLNISGGLLTLLGAVGIFISLVIQRRVERLQDILEELMDLSYTNDKNITVKIQNLIYKYQMQYMLPSQPINTIISYINLNIILVILFWSWLLFLTYQAPFQWITLIFVLPMVLVCVAMFFYRQLIQNTINPVGNHLFSSIIPSPRYLRSIAFLSSHVNVSVSTMLQQARPTPILRNKDSTSWEVVLKEELPFDDYHYYLYLKNKEKSFFESYGHILIELESDPITGKPRPTARNLNIPLGEVAYDLPSSDMEICFLIFPKGEKHPMEFCYILNKENNVYYSAQPPSFSVNHLITYSFQDNILYILKNNSPEKNLEMLPHKISADGSRWYKGADHKSFQEITIKPYIN